MIRKQNIGIAEMTTEAEYRQLLAEMRLLAEGEPDRRSTEGQLLDELAALAEAYEAHLPGLQQAMDLDRR